jgi:hypothetical protein
MGACSVLFLLFEGTRNCKEERKEEGKEAAVQETIAVQDTAAVQNIYPNTSLPMEDMSKPYMAINTFSQLFTVMFQSNTPFF